MFNKRNEKPEGLELSYHPFGINAIRQITISYNLVIPLGLRILFRWNILQRFNQKVPEFADRFDVYLFIRRMRKTDGWAK